LLVKNIAIAQEDLNDNTLIEHGQREFSFKHVQKGSVSSFLKPAFLQEIQRQKNERFFDFDQQRIL
jgi:hypothetical protein